MVVPARTDANFIKVFVHEVYVVLLAIGLAEVVFRGIQPDLSDPGLTVSDNVARIFGALLVFWVFVSYWWLWSQYVKEEVRPTQRELVFDFAILINLELMFAYYKAPLVLGGLFVLLGFLDLFWVANHLYELRATGERAHRWKWVRAKFNAIVVYGLVLGLVWYFGSLPALILILAMAVAFGCVRWFLFGEVKKIHGLVFREAQEDDIAQIVKIHNDNALENVLNERARVGRGFFLKPTTEEDVRAARTGTSERFFVAVDLEDERTVLGYVATANEIPRGILDDVCWESPGSKSFLSSVQHLHITYVAVNPKQMGRGVGQFLYDHLYQTNPHCVFSAFMSTKPYLNSRSLAFHENQGFKCWGYYCATEFRGQRNYKSELRVNAMHYAAKRDAWVTCLPIALLTLPLIALGLAFALMPEWNPALWVIGGPLLLLFLVGVALQWTLFGMSYEITSSHMIVRAGPLRQSIELDAIVEAVPTSEARYILGGVWRFRYASSADAILMKYQRANESSWEVVISPVEKSRFLGDLAKAAPGLEDVGHGTLRRRSESSA